MCRRMRLFGAVLIAGAMLGMPLTVTSAQAASMLTASVSANGGSATIIPASSSPLGINAGPIGPFTVAAAGSLSGTATSLSLDLSGSALYSVTSSPTTPQTLTIDLSAFNVTQPMVPAVLAMLSKINSGFYSSGTPVGTLELKAFVNNSNTSFAPSGSPLSTDSGAQSIPVTAGLSNTASGMVTGTGGMYAVDVELIWTIPAMTTASYTLNFDQSTNLTSVVPEPSSLVLAIAALPPLGIAVWFRRRKPK